MADTYLEFVAGYLGLWLVFFGFVGWVIFKIRRIQKQLQSPTKEQSRAS